MSQHSIKKTVGSVEVKSIDEQKTLTEVLTDSGIENDHLTLEEIVEVATLMELDGNKELILKVNSHVAQCSHCYKLFYAWRDAFLEIERLRSYDDVITDKAISSALLKNYFHYNSTDFEGNIDASRFDFDFKFPCYVINKDRFWYYPILKTSKVFSVPSILYNDNVIEGAVPFNDIEFQLMINNSIQNEQIGGIGLVRIPVEKDLEIKMLRVFPDTKSLVEELVCLKDECIYLIIVWR